MKRFYFIMLMQLCMSFTGMAQDDYLPLVREGVKWVYLENNIAYLSGQSDSRYYTIEFRSDTVVDGRLYKKCYQYAEKENTWSSLYSSKDEPYVLMREVNHQVRLYYYKFIDTEYYPVWPVGDDSETDEIILYDFDSPQEGFTFDGYINIDGHQLKKFSNGTSRFIIEGIGFVSANMGDMISIGWYTPGVERTELGLSHVEDESGRVIYKGPNYDDPLKADLTGDGKVDVADVNICINIILELNNDPELKALADITGDGVVDVSDVNAVINIILSN